MIKNFINVADYLVTGEITDHSPYFQNALNDLNDGGCLSIPFGTYYLSNLKVRGKGVKILGNNCTIIQNSNSPVFDLEGGFGESINIESVQNLNGYTELLLRQPYSELFKEQDVLKIFSEDEIPNAYQNSSTLKKRTGEFFELKSLFENKITTKSALRELYTVGINVSKLKNVSFELYDMNFSTPDNYQSLNWNSKMIRIASAKNVKISNLNVARAFDTFLYLFSIYQYKILNVEAKNLENSPSKNRYGYAINDAGSTFGVIENCTFINCRHGFTTSTASVLQGDRKPELYGRTFGTEIRNCTGKYSTAATYDVHEEGQDILFKDCSSSNDIAGEEGSGFGFQIRSSNIQLKDCTVKSSYGGIYIFMQYPNTTSNVLLDNCLVDAVEIATQIKSSVPNNKISKVTITNSTFNSKSSSTGNVIENSNLVINSSIFNSTAYQGISIKNSNISMNNILFNVSAKVDNYRLLELFSSSKVNITNSKVVIDSSAKTTGKLIRLSDANTSLQTNNLYVETISDNGIFSIFDSKGNYSGILEASNVISNYSNLVLFPPNFQKINSNWYTNDKSSGYIAQKILSTSLELTLNGSSNSSIVLVLEPTSNNLTISGISKGIINGQRVTIINKNSSSYSIIFDKTLTKNISLNTNISLSALSNLELIWIDNLWYLLT